MGLSDALKKGIRTFDFFRTSEYFRYKSQPQYKSLFGGILSILIIGVLVTTFSGKLVDTVEKVIITSESSNLNAADPVAFNISTFPEGKFMFGVEIWHLDLNTGNRYFDVVLNSVKYDTGEARNSDNNLSLEPCTLNHWEGFPDIQKDYDRLNMHHWLCLPKNMEFNIQGKYASVFSQTLEIAVKKCTNESNPQRPCASEAQVDNFFEEQEKLYFTIYFINPLINPTSSEYLTYYLEDNNYIIFTKEMGGEGILFTEEYSIKTDESILPLSNLHEQKGGIITQYALKNPYLVSNGVYCEFSFYKSGMSTHYIREFQKLDEVLSYMGGLFGTITVCLFFVRIYNETAFQIRLAFSLFHFQDEKDERTLKNYNFFSFLITGFYRFLQFFGWSPDWKTYKKYQQSGQEMLKQLDVLYLLKRIIFLEKAVNSLMEKHQIKGIHLHEKLTLDEAKKHRKYFKFKRNFSRLNKNRKIKMQIQSPFSTLGQQSNSNVQKNFHTPSPLTLSNKTVERDIFNRISPFPQFSDAAPKIKSTRKLTLKGLRYYEDDNSSSSIQSQLSDTEQIFAQMYQLKKQAKKGNSISKKIWSGFRQNIKHDISQIISQQQSICSESQDEKKFVDNQRIKEKEQSEVSATNFHKNGYNLSFPLKIKFNKRKGVYFPRDKGHFEIMNGISQKILDIKSNTEFYSDEIYNFESRQRAKTRIRHQSIQNLE